MGNVTKSKKHEIANPQNISAGDYLVSSDGSLRKVSSVTEEGITVKRRWSGEWESYGDLKEWEKVNKLRYDGVPEYLKLDKPIEEYNEDLAHYIINGLSEFESEETRSTELVTTNEREVYNRETELEAKQFKIAKLERLLKRKKDAFDVVLRDLNKQVTQVRRVIGIIELYLGIHEEIIQIREGENAPYGTQLTFRQLVLHMDEEVAIYEDGGLDFYNLDVFDDWMQDNFKQIVPEEKCVTVVRPRRNIKNYTEDSLTNSLMNDGNFTTYVVIRNGDNIYRLTNNQNIYPYLFPSTEGMEELSKKYEDALERDYDYDIEKAENELLKYKRNILMLQGLMDRTEILHPLPKGLNLFKYETHKDHLNFVYDGTGLLQDGRPSYEDWLKEINSTLKRGDRFYFCGFDRNHGYERMAETGIIPWNRSSDDPLPYYLSPDKQVYNIDRLEDQESRHYGKRVALVFKWKPDETVYNPKTGKSTERKRSNTYYVYHHDDIIINYETVKIEDIDYYLNDRINRRYYLSMFPVLKGIKKQLLEEKKMEDEFAKLIESITGKSDEEIREAIEWWKRKVIMKRPLIKEDAKAVRMITKRLK